MSAPLDFLRSFAAKLREGNIRFAITSGMACVFYGLQQTTKDSDWIIPADDLVQLRDLLNRLEQQMPPWRVSYRPIFGAPLEAEYMAHGWTSHLSVWDRADSPEHHVDIFSAPPRVNLTELSFDQRDFASRHVVAQMKKTDRDKDWFAVDGLGLQSWLQGDRWAQLHIRSVDQLRASWNECDVGQKAELARRRPILRVLEEDREKLERLLFLERTLWQCVNRERYSVYQRAWKDFYCRWRHAVEGAWPRSEPFWMQHQYIHDAARRHALPAAPLADPAVKKRIVDAGLRKAASLVNASVDELALVQPPLEEMLP